MKQKSAEFQLKSYEEETALETQLAECLKDVPEVANGTLCARVTFVRFLRGHYYDLQKAESDIRKYVEFKKERRLIGVGMKDLDSEMKWLIPIDIICNDKSGRPVMYTLLKNWKPDELYRRSGGDIKEFENFVFHFYERALHRLVKFNSNLPPGESLVTDYLHIVDHSGFGVSGFMSVKVIRLFTALGTITKSYFPDVPIIYHINTHTLFGPMRALSNGSQSKSLLFSKRSAWEPELRALVDFRKLEPYVGKSPLKFDTQVTEHKSQKNSSSYMAYVPPAGN